MKRRSFLGFLFAAPVIAPAVAKELTKDMPAAARSAPRTGARRVMLGKGADGSYGMFVSKPGFDVISSADGKMVINFSENTMTIRDDVIVDGTIKAKKLGVDSLMPVTAELRYHTPGVLKA